MKIAFVWDWEPEYYQTITWEDGLAAAVRELINRGHTVRIYCCGNDRVTIKHPYFDMHVTPDVANDIRALPVAPDAILHWGDTTRPNAAPTAQLGIPMALCFAGGEANGGTAKYFQHIFVESDVYKPRFMRMGIPVSTAFGTNTELFTPLPDQPKYFDTIFPATFAAWKRHELYAKATSGLRSLACGYMYATHEQECWQVCQENGVMIMPHVSAQALRYLYAASKVCVITSSSDGGSQRTVLEAMAMNIPLVVTDSNKFDYVDFAIQFGALTFRAEPNVQNIREMIDIAAGSPVNTRDYILENWSEHSYADALEKGLLSICQK